MPSDRSRGPRAFKTHPLVPTGVQTLAAGAGPAGTSVAAARRDSARVRAVMAMNPPDVDDIIAGKYQLLRILGRGSMGEVWLAHHRTLRESVAIKLMAQSLEAVDDRLYASKRFRLEAQVAARLSRKTRHIVQVIDHGEVDGLAYLVMEALDGVTLEAKLLKYDPLPLAEVQEVVRQLSRALEYAHAEGVLHRDLKPSNVMLTQDEDRQLLVKVLDFGIARVLRPDRGSLAFSTGHGVVCGTPGYMSPEQARGQSDLDRRCDLWALASIAYESLTNELPVAGASADELLQSTRAARTVPITQHRSDLPSAAAKFFDRAFAENVDARFASAAELAQAFEQALAECGARPYELLWAETLQSRSDPGPIRRPRRRRHPPRGWHEHRLKTGAGLAALLVGLYILATWRSRDQDPAIRPRMALASTPAVEIAHPRDPRRPPEVVVALPPDLVERTANATEPLQESAPPLLRQPSHPKRAPLSPFPNGPSSAISTSSQAELPSSASSTTRPVSPVPKPPPPSSSSSDRSAVL
jgi:serine/threonine protein kinase